MTEIGEQSSSGDHRDRVTVWIVIGLAAVCLAAVAVWAVVMGGFALFGLSVQTASQSQPAGPMPTMVMPTPAQAGVSADLWPAGETFEIADQGRRTIPDGSPVSYNSDPPTSGPYYDAWLDPGFYTEASPDGIVVHNLERGYVVIWYDCGTLSDVRCLALQEDIKALIESSAVTKLIGMPREGMVHPIALTVWTKLAFLDEFDADFINKFIDDNVNNAPEPEAP